jgi:hypothetical protein
VSETEPWSDCEISIACGLAHVGADIRQDIVTIMTHDRSSLLRHEKPRMYCHALTKVSPVIAFLHCACFLENWLMLLLEELSFRLYPEKKQIA